jgi:hypothetical protein
MKSGAPKAPLELTVSYVREIRRSCSGLVAVPIDKSPGELLWCCPKFYEDLYDRAFAFGHHYVRVHRSAQIVAQEMKEQWKRNRWREFGVWDDRGSFPVPYVLPKSKNLAKGRPIVPYTLHYLRRVYRVIGAAHSFAVARLPEGASFNIMRTSDFAMRVQQGVQEGKKQIGEGLAWKCTMGDVSNMYTELDHRAIDAAVIWGLDQNKHGARLKSVAVDRRSRATHKGRAWGLGFSDVALERIAEVSEFDNQFMFVWIKGCLARQVHGCPMGSNLSPPKAMVTCSPPEEEWIQTATRAGLPFICVRYMDDVAVFVGFDESEPRTAERAETLCRKVLTMYPEPLVLEETLPLNGRFKFLESIVKIDGPDILVRHCGHADESGDLFSGAPRRLELHPSTDPRVLRSRLMCEWHRALGNSAQIGGLVRSVWERCLSLESYCYPRGVVLATVEAMELQGRAGRAWEVVELMLRMIWGL